MATPPIHPDDRSPAPTAPPVPRALQEALGDLLRAGTLDQDQVDAVVAAWSARARPAGATAPAPHAAPPAWRGRALEAAVYLGAAFVLAAAAIVVGQQWSTFGRGMQIALVGGLSVLGLAAGLVLGLPVRPARGAALAPEHAIRRRSASVILTASAALVGATTLVVLGDAGRAGVWAVALALVVMVVTQVVAPSVLSELVLFAVATTLTGMTADLALPESRPGADEVDWESRTRIVAGTLLGFGALWAWGLSRHLRQRTLAVTLGLALCLQAALQMAGTTNTAAAVALAALGVATLLTYLKDPTWPWVTATVVASTALVFLIAGETLGPAVAFLVAGLALLGGAAVVVLLRRRRAGSAGR